MREGRNWIGVHVLGGRIYSACYSLTQPLPQNISMSSMLEIIQDLTPLNRVICSSDSDRSIDYLCELLPFRVVEYSNTDERNGWVIPPRWDVGEASIRKDGRLIYDGTAHALGVIALSAPFRGRVGLEELKRHLHYDHRYDDSLTFHYRQQYRSWDRDWGFCVPKKLYESLEAGPYDVVIDTKESSGAMKVLEYTHPGKTEYTICICANLDHPGVSNDGLSGVAVGLELFRRMRTRPAKFTYKLVLVPGIIGSEYYLGKTDTGSREKVLEALCLWMVGSRTQLALQESRSAASNIEYALERALKDKGVDFRRGPFESVIINDEYVWEAYGIPTASLSRFPYPEYHSSRDDASIISEGSLHEVVDVLERTIDCLERSPFIEKRFDGTLCLSNPRYDLYVDAGQVAFGQVAGEVVRKLRLLMDYIPSIRRPVAARKVAEHVGLSESEALSYLRRWEEKGLLKLW